MESNILCIVPKILVLSFIGSILIWLVVEIGIWSCINKTPKNKSEEKCKFKFKELTCLAFINGFIEISLFSYAIVIGIPHLIFLWIGIKTALRWDRDNIKDKERENLKDKKTENDRFQRGTYFSFLIGTALSLIFSYIITCIVLEKVIVL